jgi:hypothetical protein
MTLGHDKIICTKNDYFSPVDRGCTCGKLNYLCDVALNKREETMSEKKSEKGKNKYGVV